VICLLFDNCFIYPRELLWYKDAVKVEESFITLLSSRKSQEPTRDTAGQPEHIGEPPRVIRGTGKKGSFLSELSNSKLMFMMIAPALAFFIIFSYLPVAGLVLAFKDYNFRDGILGSPGSGSRISGSSFIRRRCQEYRTVQHRFHDYLQHSSGVVCHIRIRNRPTGFQKGMPDALFLAFLRLVRPGRGFRLQLLQFRLSI